MVERNKIAVIGCKALKIEFERSFKGLDRIDVDLFTYPITCGKHDSSFMEVSELIPDQSIYDAIFIFGSYCVKDIPEEPNVFVEHYTNCFYPLLDDDIRERYLKEGGYLVTPGWLEDWRGRIKEWGFDQNTGREYFHESTRKFVLIDTLTDDRAKEWIKELSEYLDLPYEIHEVGTFGVKNFIQKTICGNIYDLREADVRRTIDDFRRRLADLSMAQDVLSSLTDPVNEDTVIRDFMNFYSILFAPRELVLISSDGKKRILEGSRVKDPGMEVDLHSKIKLASTTYSEIYIKGIQFPEYKNSYQVLLDNTSSIFGLALANAKNFDELNRSKYSLEEINSKLIEVDEVRKEYISTLAHDIGSPMNSIQMIIEMMTSGIYGKITSDQRGHLENAMTLIKRINSLREDTLLLTRMDLNALELQREKTDLKKMIEDIISERSVSIKRKELSFHLETTRNSNGFVDPRMFRNVVENLISNAIRYNNQKGKVEIELACSEKETYLAVKDNGRGIEEQDLEKVFGRFYCSGDKIEGSTGLGLSIARGITENHGGNIWVESEGIGKGSIFKIRIPVQSS